MITVQNYWYYTHRHIKLMHGLQREAGIFADDIQHRGLQ